MIDMLPLDNVPFSSIIQKKLYKQSSIRTLLKDKKIYRPRNITFYGDSYEYTVPIFWICILCLEFLHGWTSLQTLGKILISFIIFCQKKIEYDLLYFRWCPNTEIKAGMLTNYAYLMDNKRLHTWRIWTFNY